MLKGDHAPRRAGHTPVVGAALVEHALVALYVALHALGVLEACTAEAPTSCLPPVVVACGGVTFPMLHCGSIPALYTREPKPKTQICSREELPSTLTVIKHLEGDDTAMQATC